MAQRADQSPPHLRSFASICGKNSSLRDHQPEPDASRQRPDPGRPHPPTPAPTAPFKPSRIDPLNREPPEAFEPPRIEPVAPEPATPFKPFRTDPLNRDERHPCRRPPRASAPTTIPHPPGRCHRLQRARITPDTLSPHASRIPAPTVSSVTPRRSCPGDTRTHVSIAAGRGAMAECLRCTISRCRMTAGERERENRQWPANDRF